MPVKSHPRLCTSASLSYPPFWSTADKWCIVSDLLSSLSLPTSQMLSQYSLAHLSLSYVTNAVPVLTCSPLSLPTSQMLSQYSLALLSLSLCHKCCPSTHLLSSLSLSYVPVLACSPLSLPTSQTLSQYSLALLSLSPYVTNAVPVLTCSPLSLSLLRPSTRLLSSLSPYVINAVTVLTRAVRIKRPLCPRGCAQSPHLLWWCLPSAHS